MVRTLVRPVVLTLTVVTVVALLVAGVSATTSALAGAEPTSHRHEVDEARALVAGQPAVSVETSLAAQAEKVRAEAEEAARKAAEEKARREAAAAKEAAEAAAREAERKAAAERAARAAERAAADPRSAAREMLGEYGWGEDQFGCLDSLWTRESNWNHRAQNPSSGAYGIPQSLPGGKMASAGADWQTNPLTQIEWGLGYIRDVYGSPCGAWGHSQSTGWY
ncbi:MAG: lytic transglycosylase domain-containing protein [Jiangellaceae bacterium]